MAAIEVSRLDAASVTSGRGTARNRRLSGTIRWALAWAPWLLAFLAILTRLPFITRTLYAFDSANFALAVRDFYNVAFHQPHPPGYPLYVGLARAIYVLVPDANRALILEGVALSAIAVFSTTLLAGRLFGLLAGATAGALLLFTVGFWGYGEVAYAYVALAAETATLALLAHLCLAGRDRWFVAFGVCWAVSLGIRWDAAVFCAPLGVWALLRARWGPRILAAGLAILIIAAFGIPMIQLTGGWPNYAAAFGDYLRVWAPQSAYVAGESGGGGGTQAIYNLNFLIDYLRQMLGVGILLVLYALGRRLGPAHLATDSRSRFLLIWSLPPLITYVFVHIGEAGYVLSLAPQSAILVTVSLLDLGDDARFGVRALVARGWAFLPGARLVGGMLSTVLALGIIGWNVQAFARGVGPGRLPDLRAHDATTSEQIQFLGSQPRGQILVLSHDIFRQVQFYAPSISNVLLFSEYLPNWEQSRTVTPIPPGVTTVVVLDSPLVVPPEDAPRLGHVILGASPPVSVWTVDVHGATAVEHGYRFLRIVPG